MYIDFHTKKPFVLSDFNETCKVLKYETDEISSSRSRVVACGLRDEGRTDRQTDRQTVSHDEASSPCRNSANAPKEGTSCVLQLTSYLTY